MEIEKEADRQQTETEKHPETPEIIAEKWASQLEETEDIALEIANQESLEKILLSNKHALSLTHKFYAISFLLLAIFKNVSSKLSLPCFVISS